MDYRKIYAIKAENERRIKALCPYIENTSGIYIFTRTENGFNYAYVGQAKHLLTRLSDHLKGYQHIDLSIKKHGFFSEQNPTGYEIKYFYYSEDQLNEMEQSHIKFLANSGFQLRNKTSGSQGEGKFGIAENKPPKTYRDGLAQGYKNAKRDVSKLFEKNLCFSINGTSNKNKEKALQKFKDFIGEPYESGEKIIEILGE